MKKRTAPRQTRGTSKKYTIGIDLGGTKLAAALVDAQGRLVRAVHRPTVPPSLRDMDPRRAMALPAAAEVRRHIRYVVDCIAQSAAEVSEGLAPSQIAGVGLASAGPMNIDKGTLESPANFIGWRQVKLVALVEKALATRGIRCDLRFQNDAIAGALGEGWVGRARQASTYIMVTVGTGIGSGVILNGRPAQSRGMGSEWGHLLADVGGISSARDQWYERSVEGIASGTGLIRRARAGGFKGDTASDLAAAARAGDKLALDLFRQASEALASLFFALSLGFHPEIFVVSGGMLAIRELFLPQAIEIYQDLIRGINPKFAAPIRVAKLGTTAGVIGAARLPHLKD